MDALRRVNPLMQAVIVLALAALGLIVAGPIGAGLLGIVVAVLLYALAAAWSRITLAERLLRIAVIAFVAAVALVRLSAAA